MGRFGLSRRFRRRRLLGHRTRAARIGRKLSARKGIDTFAERGANETVKRSRCCQKNPGNRGGEDRSGAEPLARNGRDGDKGVDGPPRITILIIYRGPLVNSGRGISFCPRLFYFRPRSLARKRPGERVPTEINRIFHRRHSASSPVRAISIRTARPLRENPPGRSFRGQAALVAPRKIKIHARFVRKVGSGRSLTSRAEG